MTLPRLGIPPSGDPFAAQRSALLNAELDRREPIIIGLRDDGVSSYLRFRAALATPYVQVQVQDVATGGAAYTGASGACVSRTLVDCRSNRLQDVTLTDNGNPLFVFLVPVQYDGAGLKILFDGQAGRPDNMAFVQTWS